MVAGNVISTGTRFALSQKLANFVHRVIGQMVDGIDDRQGLEGFAHHEDLQQLGRIQRPHASTYVGLDDDETLAGELSKGLSDGDSTRAALTRDSFLNDPLSRHELAIEDLLSQGAGDVMSKRLSVICSCRRAQDWIQTIAARAIAVKAAPMDRDDWIQLRRTSLDGRQAPWHS
jgi:hypothetical protein